MNNGAEIKAIPHSVVANEQYFMKPGLTWSTVASKRFSVREFNEGFIFDNGGCCIFDLGDNRDYIAALLNSQVFVKLFSDINPTLNFQSGDVARFPVISSDNAVVSANARRCVEEYRADWDSVETSWDFQSCPLIGNGATLSDAVLQLEARQRTAIENVQKWEEDNNRCLAVLYGLESEIQCEVPVDTITLYIPIREEDIKRLLSYAIGCMMGRYSLDKPGLVYAHSGNQGFDSGQYKTFRADDDGIIPLLETDWGIRDDAPNRVVEFIGVAWPKEHLEENLKFVADSLGPTSGEQPRDTIRRYLATGFYKHHLSMYKKRPIYWLFSSGKQRAFQCLVYLHRYHEGTLARMRTEYAIPLMGKFTARLEQLEGKPKKGGKPGEREGGDIDSATSVPMRRKLEKERDAIKKQIAELQEFDARLRHYADQRIKLDLDDGVKTNYGKFSDPDYGDILADVKAISGGSVDE
jgi:hypothetical protein